ncbi:MAG: sterol desaturase family protein [Acidiferrobacterales bacterium]|nr:sterol desaturase family protein [Acidiferrobacterales bacterium]
MNNQQSSIANSRLWNHVPELPVQYSPLFDWPPNLSSTLRWLARVWKPVGLYFITLAIVVIIYLFFHPPEEMMREFAFGWVAQIWLRNLILMCLVAGTLHCYFYMLKKQKDNLKFEKKGQDANSKVHNFGNQVLDNMFWTLTSGLAIWTAYEAVYYWAHANGFVPALTWAGNPVWFVLVFLLIPLWSSMHFYFIHRLLHWPPLFRVAHAVHHRNVNIGPWSGISMHPIEHVLFFSSVAIHFVIASHPVHMIFHAYFQGLAPAVSHSGYEALSVGGEKRMKLGDYFHQLHHKHYKCNYGTVEMPWDRWFGSFHDGTEDATRRIRKRKW